MPQAIALPSGVRFERVLNALSIFTMVMTVPQVLSVWVGRDASGVSILSWSAYLLAAIVWFVHGLRKRDPAIYLACIGWMLLDSAVIVGVLIH